MLRKMANMRAAKARKRLSNPKPEPEPKFTPWHPLELGLRDKITGETAWVDFVSLRDAMRRLAARSEVLRVKIMRLGNEIHKTRVVRGSEVVVRGRKCRIVDARLGQAKIEFRFWFVTWCRWIPLDEVTLPDVK